ncbi:type II secretion system protein, partial [bacterium]|nr:type II secretion system protein [bacterium]
MKNLKTLVESQFPLLGRGLGRGGDKKSAFTLAEVLITLGVIGVVAAMTLPTLIHNYQKTVYVNQLKKSYSILEQAFQKMMADDGVQKLSDTSVWASKGNTTCAYYMTPYTGNSNCKAFVNSLNKYIKIIGIEKYVDKIPYLKGNETMNYINYDSLVLSDGTMIMFEASGSPFT